MQETEFTASDLGCLYGPFIGDALSMPVHWYYDRQALKRDYGWVDRFLAPKNPHPNSILWRSTYESPSAKGDILHEQSQYWGQRDVHYHQFLEPGENTLNLKLCALALGLFQKGRYSSRTYLEEYIRFLTTPGAHRDTYLEECHRGFFRNYALGRNPAQCAVKEKHIGGLCNLVVPYVFTRDSKVALDHMSLTHAGSKMTEVGRSVLTLLDLALAGEEVLEAARKEFGSRRLGWIGLPDEEVLGGKLSIACYVEDAWPAVVYLFLKYFDRPQKALEVNTNMGGDNCYRGAVLGALLGAVHGISAWPEQWRRGLKGNLLAEIESP